MTSLRLSPIAALHWQFLAHIVDTEATAFGITDENDGLLVQRLWVPKQECSTVTTETDDGEFNELAEWAYDNKIKPTQIGKIWLHTHPGSSPHPSGTDETTFREKFGNCDWAVMAILAKGGDDYARVKFKAGGSHSFVIPVVRMWQNLSKDMPDLSGLSKEWEKEVKEKIREKKWIYTATTNGGQYGWRWDKDTSSWISSESEKKRENGGNAGATDRTNTDTGFYQGNPHYRRQGKMSELVGPNAGKSMFLDGDVVEIASDGTEINKTVPDEAEKDRLEILHEFEQYMNKAYGVRVDDLTTDQLMDGYKDFCDSFGYEYDLDDIFPERAEYYISDSVIDLDDYSEYEVFDICMDCGMTKKLDNGYCQECAKARSTTSNSDEAINAKELHDKKSDLIPLCRV